MTLSQASRNLNKWKAQIPCNAERDGQMYFGDAEFHCMRLGKETQPTNQKKKKPKQQTQKNPKEPN